MADRLHRLHRILKVVMWCGLTVSVALIITGILLMDGVGSYLLFGGIGIAASCAAVLMMGVFLGLMENASPVRERR